MRSLAPGRARRGGHTSSTTTRPGSTSPRSASSHLGSRAVAWTSGRLDRLARIAASDHWGDQVARDYFIAVAADEERVATIRQVLTEGDLSLAVHRAIGRAFGTNLRTVAMEADFAGREAIREFRDPHIRSFLADVALREAARQPAPEPPPGSQRRE
jgi:hypothetical protein